MPGIQDSSKVMIHGHNHYLVKMAGWQVIHLNTILSECKQENTIINTYYNK